MKINKLYLQLIIMTTLFLYYLFPISLTILNIDLFHCQKT